MRISDWSSDVCSSDLLYNFTIASFLAGVMGAFYAHYLGILSPSPEEFGVYRTVEILSITYIGGRGTLWGSLFSGFLLIGFHAYFRGLGPWPLVIFRALPVFVMLFARRGLAGLREYPRYGEAPPKSEEPKSELQSQKRHMYALFS